MLMDVLTRRAFDFSGLDANLSQSVELAEAIDLADWMAAVVSVRVHDFSLGAGQAVAVLLSQRLIGAKAF
jgi:hypothetical protein